MKPNATAALVFAIVVAVAVIVLILVGAWLGQRFEPAPVTTTECVFTLDRAGELVCRK